MKINLEVGNRIPETKNPTNTYRFVLEAMMGDADSRKDVEFDVSVDNPYISQLLEDMEITKKVYNRDLEDLPLHKWLNDSEDNPSYHGRDGESWEHQIYIEWPYDHIYDRKCSFQGYYVRYFDALGLEYAVKVVKGQSDPTHKG